MSEDEVVTRDILLEEPVRCVLQVGDGKNLKRTLLLSLQLAEMNIPFMLNLNMMDESRQKGIHIDTTKLSKLLGIQVNKSIAIRKSGTDKLNMLLGSTKASEFKIKYPSAIEKAFR